MAARPRPSRLALVVHPTRPLDVAVATIAGWAEQAGLELIQLPMVSGPERHLAPPGELAPGDFVVSLGGDGTVLGALRAAAAVEEIDLQVARRE